MEKQTNASTDLVSDERELRHREVLEEEIKKKVLCITLKVRRETSALEK